MMQVWCVGYARSIRVWGSDSAWYRRKRHEAREREGETTCQQQQTTGAYQMSAMQVRRLLHL